MLCHTLYLKARGRYRERREREREREREGERERAKIIISSKNNLTFREYEYICILSLRTFITLYFLCVRYMLKCYLYKDIGHNKMTIQFFVESQVRIRNWFDLWWQFADIRWNKKCLRFNCINFQPSSTFIT